MKVTFYIVPALTDIAGTDRHRRPVPHRRLQRVAQANR